eukprot:scaffold25934_cov56-Phaeocystis_antarctica.AAC.5
MGTPSGGRSERKTRVDYDRCASVCRSRPPQVRTGPEARACSRGCWKETGSAKREGECSAKHEVSWCCKADEAAILAAILPAVQQLSGALRLAKPRLSGYLSSYRRTKQRFNQLPCPNSYPSSYPMSYPISNPNSYPSAILQLSYQLSYQPMAKQLSISYPISYPSAILSAILSAFLSEGQATLPAILRPSRTRQRGSPGQLTSASQIKGVENTPFLHFGSTGCRVGTITTNQTRKAVNTQPGARDQRDTHGLTGDGGGVGSASSGYSSADDVHCYERSHHRGLHFSCDQRLGRLVHPFIG